MPKFKIGSLIINEDPLHNGLVTDSIIMDVEIARSVVGFTPRYLLYGIQEQKYYKIHESTLDNYLAINRISITE